MKYTQNEVLKHYDSSKYITPDGYTADITVFTIISEKTEEKAPPHMKLKMMLIKRADLDREKRPNMEGGKWALPGGFINAGDKETALEAARRELKEETNIEGLHIKHFAVYDNVDRDARGWMISNAFYAIVPENVLKERRASDDAAEVELIDMEAVSKLDLAFDHDQIIKDALAFIKKEMLTTTIAKNFLPKEFTLSELQRVLLLFTDDQKISNDSVFFTKAPKLSFIEKAVDIDGTLKKTNRHSFRPSQLYVFNQVEVVESIYR
ncbi:NUDIX domain-containing protein [Bacillus sp. B1-b2]|uniref:NUDIX domain-containing protein n=1 Tax=Bacillus sp. B1-b2 TaxID=2653201 RepID=UPI0039B0F19E